MTREETRPTLDLQLSSEQLSETRSDLLARTAKEARTSHCLTLYPGEPNELQVRIRNTSDRPLNLALYLEFESASPKTWFQGWIDDNWRSPKRFWYEHLSLKFWMLILAIQLTFLDLILEACLDVVSIDTAFSTNNPFLLLQLQLTRQSNFFSQFSDSFSWFFWTREPQIKKELEVAANTQKYLGLYFRLPDGFFETDDVLHLETPTAERKYPAILEVYRGDRQSGTLVGYRPFQLEIRPRSSYVHFLPSLYRQVDFFDRFLKIMEEGFDPALQTSDFLWAYLDPLTSPEALLPFLAHWVGWKLDSRIDEISQRQLIRNAIKLHRLRGTREGLRLYLHLATGLPLDGDAIHIDADLNSGFVLGKVCLGEAPRLGGGKAYHFRVRLRPETPLPIDEFTIRDIIQEYKPAVSTYELAIEMR